MSTILTSLNAARQIGTAIIALQQDEKVRDKVSELKDRISDAQDGLYRLGEERSDLAAKIRELEQRIEEYESWRIEQKRYELVELAPGRMAMRLKPQEANCEPIHLCCANCFVERKKKFLTSTSHSEDWCQFKCAGCDQEISYAPNGRRAGSYSITRSDYF